MAKTLIFIVILRDFPMSATKKVVLGDPSDVIFLQVFGRDVLPVGKPWVKKG